MNSTKRSELPIEVAAFEDRGLDCEIADRMGARFLNGRFQFDYLSNGELQFRKMRTPEKEFFLDRKGVKLQFWNIDSLRGLPSPPEKPLTITEGEFDSIAIQQACGDYVVSVPNGVAGKRSDKSILIAEDSRFSYLWHDERLIREIDQFDKIILATDNDEPGIILRDELALRIGEARCWYVIFPEGCKDANDVVLKNGVEALRRVISEARPMRPGYLLRPSEVPPRRFEIAYSSGWGKLDLVQGRTPSFMLVRPELVVVTGEPGHGKGQWIRALACHLAESHGMRTAFLAPEDPPHRIKRDLKRFAQRNPAKLSERAYPSQEQQAHADAWVDAHFRISMPPDDEPLTLDAVEQEMMAAALQHGCQVFVIDPWNEVEHAFANGETETMYIERSLRRLKRHMRRLGLILIIAAHPTKLSPGNKATLYTISGSANWRNKADHGIIIYREDNAKAEIEVTFEKSKDHETMGLPGVVGMRFYPYQADYEILP